MKTTPTAIAAERITSTTEAVHRGTIPGITDEVASHWQFCRLPDNTPEAQRTEILRARRIRNAQRSDAMPAWAGFLANWMAGANPYPTHEAGR